MSPYEIVYFMLLLLLSLSLHYYRGLHPRLCSFAPSALIWQTTMISFPPYYFSGSIFLAASLFDRRSQFSISSSRCRSSHS